MGIYGAPLGSFSERHGQGFCCALNFLPFHNLYNSFQNCWHIVPGNWQIIMLAQLSCDWKCFLSPIPFCPFPYTWYSVLAVLSPTQSMCSWLTLRWGWLTHSTHSSKISGSFGHAIISRRAGSHLLFPTCILSDSEPYCTPVQRQLLSGERQPWGCLQGLRTCKLWVTTVRHCTQCKILCTANVAFLEMPLHFYLMSVCIELNTATIMVALAAT